MRLRQSLFRLLDAIAIPNISLYIVIGQVAVFGTMAFRGDAVVERILFVPGLVLQGEVWRIFTFILTPPSASPIFLIFAWYLFWLMGSALENHWGTTRYNLFLLIGWVLTISVALFSPTSGIPVSNAFLGASVFLAFAFLAPDFELLLFFILPVKMKWLAVFQWCSYAFIFVVGGWSERLAVLASVGNFFCFFGRDLWDIMRRRKRRSVHRARQARDAAEDDGPRFRCVICGKNSDADPDLDFRYCSKCAGDQCYCPEHIRDHEHVVESTEAASGGGKSAAD